MSDELNPITQSFVDRWLMDVTAIFRQAVVHQPKLEAHFNGVSIDILATELLVGAVQDLERYGFDLDSGNLDNVSVKAKLDDGGAVVETSFLMPEQRKFH